MLIKCVLFLKEKFRATRKSYACWIHRREEEKEGDGLEKTITSTELGEQELDWTSKLPDDVVIHLLSFLAFKEAIRTSVLSVRWRDLWKSANLAVEFEARKEMRDLYNRLTCEDGPVMAESRRWYKNWVNGPVRQLQNTKKLKKFSVGFSLTNLCNREERDIDRWVEFAISKRVESLVLALYVHHPGDTSKYYSFSEVCYNHIKTPDGVSDIKSLRSMRLSCVDVRAEILEHFISSCPLLEELALEGMSKTLRKLRVVGSSQSPLRLTYFELRYCEFLESLEIDHAPRLVRLIYDSCPRMEDLRVCNCPGLVDLTLGLINKYNFTFKAFSGCASQLKSLLLKTTFTMGKKFSRVTEHSHLERLMVQVTGGGDRSLVELIPLVNACPRLHTLQVFLHTGRTEFFPYHFEDLVHTKMYRESIQLVEIFGFRGYEMDCDLVKYVMEYFSGLKRIIVDRSIGTPFLFDEWMYDGKKIKSCTKIQADNAEQVALGFKAQAPPKVEFIVI